MKRDTAELQDPSDTIRPDFEFSRGRPLPLGATLTRNGINFSIFSRHATSVTLVIFRPSEHDPIGEFALDPRYNRTGDVWHAFVGGIDPGIEYGFRVDRVPNHEPQLYRFDRRQVLIDPYAKELSGGATWGGTLHLRTTQDSASKPVILRHSLVADQEFDWGSDQPLNIHLADSIIYEMHVRGFTQHPSSNVKASGTFLGVLEKIPYLRELGVTAVELMPITEFEENDNPRINPLTGEPLRNFWGYHPISFFAPKASYASRSQNGHPLREFKTLVKALHAAGIEVILDMVFNHTAEGDERGPTFCFRGLDNTTYYIIDQDTGKYANFSGCGNTLNCNHPVVHDLILDCLRYWVTEMHVDGFRFDLASILGRGRDGSVLSNPPVLERIAADPVLANTKLIAEAWDAAGLYQVGHFPNWGRWAEWNGKFRDDIRRFLRGDPGMVPLLATRMAGSADLYQYDGRTPYHSINFVTSHDGFTLADLVAYNRKHNLANGENDTDGMDENLSWNCGEEGPTQDPDVLSLRRRQTRNFIAILFFSQGVPMILHGDEFGRTQLGNNNAYCQDNEISWVNWDLRNQNADLFRFFRLLIQFRKRHAALRRRTFFQEGNSHPADVIWHGVKCGQPDWSWDSRTLGMQLAAPDGQDEVLLLANSHWEDHEFELPRLMGKSWFRLLDTSLPSPSDILEEGTECRVRRQDAYRVCSRSVVVLLGRPHS
ncbi:MAG: glycogen debranching protein GlgX [Acidobacteriota bacterium]